MTSSLPSAAILDEYQGIGVPDDSIAIMLQRGGEEILLTRVENRFTVSPSANSGPVENWVSKIPATWLRHVPGSNLEEFSVDDPEKLKDIMATARALDEIDFASRVYHPANNVGTYFYLSNQITIQFDPKVSQEARDTIASHVGVKQLKAVEGIPNTFVYQLTTDSTENPVKITNRLTRYPEVFVAEPNIIIQSQTHYTPRDPLYPKQWYLNNKGGDQVSVNSHISAEKAWDITRGSRSIVLAIADDSVDLNHPDFKGAGKIVAPMDFKDNDTSPLPGADSDNHGTACAGVAVAEENGKGIVGVAPGCALMPIRTTGYLDDDSVESVFNWAIDKGASVISCSWGPSAVYFPLSLRQRAIITKAATQGRKGKGAVVVFAAGNANRPINGTINERGWPNNVLSGQTKWLGGFTVHPDVITVAACTSLNKKAAYSNWGSGIFVCAPSNNAPPGMWLQETGFVSTPPEVTGMLPGLGIFTDDRVGADGYDTGDYTGYFGGTSSATPVVAGVAALVLSANPDLSAQQVKTIIQQSADKIVDPDPDPQFGTRQGSYDSNGHSEWFGYGKVNAYKAVQMAVQMRTGGGSGGRLSDISGHWAQAFIEALVGMNVISGFPDGTFQPNSPLTRVQYAALLTNAFNAVPKRAATNFVDVPLSFWGRDVILKANRAGFLSGYPGMQFRPQQILTRLEALLALVSGLGLSGGTPDSLNVYGDVNQIPTFAVSAIAAATVNHIVVNYPYRSLLSPNQSITRGEVCAFIYQCLVATKGAKPINSAYIV
ncbi:MAG: S8 family serine peptidase [Microcoleaceae cyanobacterium]